MLDAAVYECWEASRPNVTQRSYFYPLAPIGMGTATVESLTGYISRLAAAHAVKTGTLILHELRPRIPCTKGVSAGRVPKNLSQSPFYLDMHSLNGVGIRARTWVALLEQLTCMPRLNVLTVLPWANAISCVHLLRTRRAWCSSCYGSDSGQPPYEHLLWALQMVTACPVHHQRLESVCPSCGRTQYVLSPRLRPGYCSRCHRWLGRAGESRSVDEDLAEAIAVAEMVGELLAASSALPAQFGLDLLRENIRGFVWTAGGYRRLSAQTRGVFVRGWIQRESVPRLNSLVELSRSLGVSLVRLLTERINTRRKTRQMNTHQKYPWKAHYRVASDIVEDALRVALQAAIPPSLREIAGQVGYRSVEPLQFRYRALCGEIVHKRRAAMRSSYPSPTRAPVPRERIEKALTAELGKPGFTDLGAVAASVGLSSQRRLYKGFHDLRVAIIAKNATIRKQRLEANRSALTAVIEASLGSAFHQQPVPTVEQVARSLGYATTKPLTSRFSELCEQLRACRYRLRQVKRRFRVNRRFARAGEHVRQRLTEALGEFPPPSCAQIVRSISGHRTQIRETFPELWRAIHERYVEYTREARRVKREVFADEVHLAFRELRRQGIYPTARLVLAAIPQPQFRSLELVAHIMRHARHELSTKGSIAYPCKK
jgi:AraC-like DNA-binding protein